MSHHHEQRSVMGKTVLEVIKLWVEDKNIPADAVFDALPGDSSMIPGPDGYGYPMTEPVLTWRVDDD